MKMGIKIAAVLSAACVLFALAGCVQKSESSENELKTATGDEAYTVPTDAVEESANVNGMRFNLTLWDFTERINKEKKERGETEFLNMQKWDQSGTESDENGVQVQYWHYDDDDVSYTATVETNSDKLLNVGCGTTMSQYMGTTGNDNNSDLILDKVALMAKAACGFQEGSEEMLRDIFYRTTTEAGDTLWYDGFVFNLSTRKDEADSKNNIMLFRIFPITNELKAEWKLEEY